MVASEGNVHVSVDDEYSAPIGLYRRCDLSTMSECCVSFWRKTMARKLGFADSRAASTNKVSVFKEPAAPPKKRISAFDLSATCCAALFGDHPGEYASSRVAPSCFWRHCLLRASNRSNRVLIVLIKTVPVVCRGFDMRGNPSPR